MVASSGLESVAMPQVLIRMDAAGEWPVVVEDDEELPGGAAIRWRYVCDGGVIPRLLVAQLTAKG